MRDGRVCVRAWRARARAAWVNELRIGVESLAHGARWALAVARRLLTRCRRCAQFARALEIAMRLRQPRHLRTALEQLLRRPRGEEELRASVHQMDDDGLLHLLHCARDWNTTAQHSLTAHRLLHALLQSTPAARLAELPRIKEAIEALMPYADRHFERLDRLLQARRYITVTLPLHFRLLQACGTC